jgi:hypothetical protein
MWNIFKEDFKNTRFILTVLALGLLGFFGIAIIYLIEFHTGDIQEGLMGLLTTLLGAIIAIVSVATIRISRPVRKKPQLGPML